MQIERILNHDLTLLIARSNEGKSNLLCSLIKQYKAKYRGDVYSFGLSTETTEKLKIEAFNSLMELEKIRNSLIFIDEVGKLIDLNNRKLRGQVESIFRLVNHNGNKLVLSGLPGDFKRFICAKAKCFIYKSLNISDLINGTLAKELLMQYQGNGRGMYSFLIPKDEFLCCDGDGKYFTEKFSYQKEFDKKCENVNLFEEKK